MPGRGGISGCGEVQWCPSFSRTAWGALDISLQREGNNQRSKARTSGSQSAGAKQTPQLIFPKTGRCEASQHQHCQLLGGENHRGFTKGGNPQMHPAAVKEGLPSIRSLCRGGCQSSPGGKGTWQEMLPQRRSKPHLSCVMLKDAFCASAFSLYIAAFSTCKILGGV